MTTSAAAVEPRLIGEGGSDGEVFSDLYEIHYHRLVRRVTTTLPWGGEAEEIAQEAFLRAWASFHRYDRHRPFWPWVAVIADNLCVDRLREAYPSRRHIGVMVTMPTPEVAPEDAVVESEERAAIGPALARLDARQRRLILLRGLTGLSYEDIAAHEHVTVETVRCALRRARARARANVGR